VIRPFQRIGYDDSGERVGRDYVPLDDLLRTEMYHRTSGIAEGWPIPLTRCTIPQRGRR
jgi:hypothetical protein